MENRIKIDELITENQEHASKIFAHQNLTDELINSKKIFSFQNEKKKKQVAKLINANKVMSEALLIAHQELAFQNKEKEKRADELLIANVELAFQSKEKEKRAAELLIANVELDLQSKEKEKRAAELLIANVELDLQSKEKEKRAAELLIAKVELDLQSKEKEKREAELLIAKVELDLQSKEKEKRVAELLIAKVELDLQSKEKEKRAAELLIANVELDLQNKEKEKRAAELLIINKELKQFAYIASHELKEPIRTIANFIQIINEDNLGKFDEKTLEYFQIIDNSTKRMTILINTLLNFSRLGINKKLSNVDCKELIDSVLVDLSVIVKSSRATIEVSEMPKLNVYEIEFRQLFQNLISNAIKFHQKDSPPKIQIRSEKINEGYKFSVSDNGIGIDPSHFDRVFDMFQRLHNTEEVFEGKGIGLAYCKKIVHMHKGEIWVESELDKGSTFYFTIFPISS